MGRLFRYGDIIKVAQNPYVFAWVNQVIANGGTVTDAEKAAVRTFVESIDIVEFDRLWVFGLGNEIAAKTSIVNPSATIITNVNGVAFTPSLGFTGNGSTSYLDTNYNALINGVKFSASNGSFGIYSRTDSNSGSSEMGLYNGTFFTQIYAKDFGIFYGYLQDGNNASSLVSDSLGLFSVVRNSSRLDLYKNGLSTATNIGSFISTLANYNIFICARNLIGTPSNYSSRNLSFAWLGSGSINQFNLNSSVQALATTLGFNV